MKAFLTSRSVIFHQLAVVLLASAFAVPALAQEAQGSADQPGTPSAAVQERPSPMATQQPSLNTAREGFWGRVNPFARKKWVNNRVEPIRGQVNELNEVNAKNAQDIQDVDGRAQAGIHRAQSSADAANQRASAAGSAAQRANETALGASAQVDKLDTTVDGLDQYRQSNEIEVEFHGSQAILPSAARKQLDGFAASLSGRQGYVLEIEGHSPLAGTAGIQSSERLAEAVKRYLVTQDQIPVYRMHSVALGNALAAGTEESRPVRTSSVHIRLMENSLAAQELAPPQNANSLSGEERP
jgi:outer membrane protein OmpA-like peptidoglycan-associated protein